MLNVDVKTLEDGRVELLVEADADEVAVALSRGIETFLSQMGVPSHPEADPLEYLQAIAGDQASGMVKAAVMNYLVPFAITQCGRIPVAAPDTDAVGAPVAGAPFAFTASYYERPVLELSSYDPVEVSIPGVRPVTDDEVEDQLLMLAQQFADVDSDPESGEQRTVVPAVTDAWVKATFGAQGIEDVAGLRDAMRQAGEQFQADAFEQNRHFAVIGAYSERLVGEIPEGLVDDFAEEMAGMMQMQMQMEMQCESFEDCLAAQGVTEDMFLAGVREQAQRALRDSLTLSAIFRHAGLELTEDSLLETAAALQPEGDPRALLAQFQDEGRMFMLRENAECIAATQWALEHASVNVL